MTGDSTWIERAMAAKTWEELLEDLLSEDVYLIRPFSKIREHPCWTPILELLRGDDLAIAKLIGYLENFHVLGQWALILLPSLTGENPVPESHRDDLFLELFDWTAWAKQQGIEPVI